MDLREFEVSVLYIESFQAAQGDLLSETLSQLTKIMSLRAGRFQPGYIFTLLVLSTAHTLGQQTLPQTPRLGSDTLVCY